MTVIEVFQAVARHELTPEEGAELLMPHTFDQNQVFWLVWLWGLFGILLHDAVSPG